ncbi:MAG: methyltransferase domain-containing protein [Candidatus Hodarchaeales archaeon]|jgi:SAM-dependent methyltransferase
MNIQEETIQESYSNALKRKKSSSESSCCSPQTQSQSCCPPSTQSEAKEPVSFGCIYLRPILNNYLKQGMTVIDLGSGAGHDLMIAAEFVGPNGKAIGVDFTDDMIKEAQMNAQKNNYSNVTLVKANIRNIPLPDNSADVIISNCVINLALDKALVFKEVFRLLKPGGIMIDADVIATKPLSREIRENSDLWCSCVGGALTQVEHEKILSEIGFTDISVKFGNKDDVQFEAPELAVQSGVIFAKKPIE